MSIDLKKQLEFFDPDTYVDGEEIHVIGVGAIGSQVVEMLARMGFNELSLYDFDVVDPHNITNQMYFADQFEKSKLECTMELCQRINPHFTAEVYEEGWKQGMPLAGHVILAVDNIDLRRQIVEEHMNNPMIVSMCDFRMGLTNAQHYFADWQQEKLKKNFLASMQFTHEEAKESTPVSACGTSLNVLPTVRMITALGTANFMNFLKNGEAKKVILTDAFLPSVEAY